MSTKHGAITIIYLLYVVINPLYKRSDVCYMGHSNKQTKSGLWWGKKEHTITISDTVDHNTPGTV